MYILWYVSVCAGFFGISYIIDQKQENKRLKAQLHEATRQPEIRRQFVNMQA